METLLKDVTALGAGAKQHLGGPVIKHHTMTIKIVIASTAVTVDLEGSIDGELWFQLRQVIMSAAEITALKSMSYNVGPQPVDFVRANLITNTGGGAVTVKHSGV